MSTCITHGIRISVASEYLADESEPLENKFLFRYDITITNEGDRAAQLIARHWIIRDDAGHIEEVQGEGVVGQQPFLAPGDSFRYSSWCPIQTPCGIMRGVYHMTRPEGENFQARIAPFGLWMPSWLN